MDLLRHLPNLITMLRLMLVIPIVVFLHEGRFELAVILFAIAGLSDGLDGLLARRFDWVTPFGKMIDPVADKLLLLATTVTLGVMGHFPIMLLILMITKDLAILCGIMAYTFLAGFPEIKPVFLGKVTTTLQILLIIGIIVGLIIQQPWLESRLLPGLIWLIASVTLLDGIVYLWLWTDKLAEDARWRGQQNP